MKETDIREISLSAIIAALYATLVIVLAPISFGPVQLRVADCLIPLAAIFGWPATAGVALGAFVGNAYFWLGPLDVVFGPAANLVAAGIIYYLRRRLIPACVSGATAIGVIVGGYLWIYFPPPEIVGLSLPVWGAMMLSITISSLIAVAIIGYLLVRALNASGFVRQLESRGLKTHLK